MAMVHQRSVKDDFYAKLQDTVGRVVRSDVLIVMWDLNARVGDETDVWEEVLGRPWRRDMQ